MTFTIWFVVVGLLLIGMALGGSVPRRLPVTTSILYRAVRVCLGPHGVGLPALDPLDAPELLHRLAEVAVIVSFLAPAGRTTEQVNQVVAPAPRTYVGESREVPSWPWGTKSSKGASPWGRMWTPARSELAKGPA